MRLMDKVAIITGAGSGIGHATAVKYAREGAKVALIDHVGVAVSDVAKSKSFYRAALAPLRYAVIMEFDDAAGFGIPPSPDFWIGNADLDGPSTHVAFQADSRAQVDAFYKAAMAAGGRDNGPPGLRPHYHANYYAAFVLDPDGHNIEAVCHAAA